MSNASSRFLIVSYSEMITSGSRVGKSRDRNTSIGFRVYLRFLLPLANVPRYTQVLGTLCNFLFLRGISTDKSKASLLETRVPCVPKVRKSDRGNLAILLRLISTGQRQLKKRGAAAGGGGTAEKKDRKRKKKLPR